MRDHGKFNLLLQAIASKSSMPIIREGSVNGKIGLLQTRRSCNVAIPID